MTATIERMARPPPRYTSYPRDHEIERLLCGFRFDALELVGLCGTSSLRVVEEAHRLAYAKAEPGLSEHEGVFTVEPGARSLVRKLASRSDAYLDAGTGRHSTEV